MGPRPTMAAPSRRSVRQPRLHTGIPNSMAAQLRANTPTWKNFETAVGNFVAALDPSAEVTHDAIIPDIDTGLPRQRDVWVEAKFGQHFPIKILLSCKYWEEKLNVQDIDAFLGELRSSGAHKGVIYARTGFTPPAIGKALANDVCCCLLYRNQPPDLPNALTFQTYLCTPSIRTLLPQGCPDPQWALAVWNDLFDVPIDNREGGKKTALDVIVAAIFDAEEKAATRRTDPKQHFPSEIQTTLKLAEKGRKPINLTLHVAWNVYRGKLEAHLLDGSYSVTSGDFKAMQLGPAISLRDGPGPGWELLEGPPSIDRPGVVTVILTHGEATIREGLVKYLGPQPL